jgi:SAM-dependent methyltransferase
MDDEWFRDWFDTDYAALYAHRDEAEAETAVHTLLAAAPELAGGPVLDLGCGTGRHLKALFRTNPEALGMDLSRPLLDLADPSLRHRLVRGDMRALPFREASLAGACLWFTPFGYFGDETNAALAKDLGRIVRPGGLVLLDYLDADHLAAHLVPEDVQERNGLRVHSRRYLEGPRVVKRMRIEHLAGGPVREVSESVRLYRPGELLGLFAAGGFRLRRAFGDYQGRPHTAGSPRWIGLLERRT